MGRLGMSIAISYIPASVIESVQFTLEPAKALLVPSKNPLNDLYNRNSICFIASGLGNDMTADYILGFGGSEGLGPVLQDYCQTVRLVPSNHGVRYSDLSLVAKEYIARTAVPNQPVDVYFYGGSMGALSLIGSGEAITDAQQPITIKAVLADSSPVSEEDTSGWLETKWVDGLSGIEGKQLLGHGYKNQVSFAVEYVSNIKKGNIPLTFDDVREVARVSGGCDQRLYLSQLATIKSFKDTVNVGYLRDVPMFFLHANDPSKDTTVNVGRAASSWHQLLPQTITIPVPGGGHANPNEVDYSQPVRHAFTLAGAKTIAERIAADEQRLTILKSSTNQKL